MEMMDLSRAQWQTSSYSGGNGACVEIAMNASAHVLVRDSKDRKGPVLTFRSDSWRRFTRHVKVRALSVSPPM